MWEPISVCGLTLVAGVLVPMIKEFNAQLAQCHVEKDLRALTAVKEYGDTYLCIYPLPGHHWVFWLYHLAVAIWTPSGWEVHGFGGEGLQTQENIEVWNEVHLHALLWVGKAVRSYAKGMKIPVLTKPGVTSSFDGEDIEYNILHHNCQDAAISLIGFITMGRFKLYPQAFKALMMFREVYTSNDKVKLVVDKVLESDSMHFGDDISGTLSLQDLFDAAQASDSDEANWPDNLQEAAAKWHTRSGVQKRLSSTYAILAASKMAMKGVSKAMKANTAMKASIARGKRMKYVVFDGRYAKTSGGLKKSDLAKNKNGKIVSRKKSAIAKKNFKKLLGGWSAAMKQARKELKIKGFVLINRGAVGKALYKRAKAIYNQ